MRAILLILIIAVVALIAALQTGLININQTRPATAPTVEAGDGAIRTQAGQAPAFEVETGSVGVGTREANVGNLPLGGALGNESRGRESCAPSC